MVPMRLCSPDEDITGDAPHELVQNVISVRKEHLSVLLFGFPTACRLLIEEYLREWFHCTFMEPVDSAQPDITLVEEENDEIADDVSRTAQHYGRCGVLLSIAMVPDSLSKPMRLVQGYRKWERIPRPIGPSMLGKVLLKCIVKLRELREEEANGDDSRETHTQDTEDQPHRRSDASDNAVSRPLIRSPSSNSSRSDPSKLRVMVVEDNAINRKLLCASLQIYGCRNVQCAENGAVAVKMVETHPQLFDIIFMGSFLTLPH